MFLRCWRVRLDALRPQMAIDMLWPMGVWTGGGGLRAAAVELRALLGAMDGAHALRETASHHRHVVATPLPRC